ncbi:hypothetical protein AB5N19_14258 [Seiridium cardinale]|uniref:Uncharacterized protein n=1 Tax=Seiridium cardinale TaxID=138064 RepID=A0ABR2XGC2_9PEZI
MLPYRCHSKSLHSPDVTDLHHPLSKGAASPPCSTKPRNSRHQTFAAVPRAYCLSPVSSMNSPPTRSPSVEAIKAVVSRAVPNVSIESIQLLNSARLQRDVCVTLSNGKTLVLTIPPPPILRLLRSEQWLVLSEALVIPWICRRASEYAANNKRISIQYLIEADPPQNKSSARTDTSSRRPRTPEEYLIEYLPNLIAHSSASVELGTAFSLTEAPRGILVNSLPRALADAERVVVEYQKGQLVRRISNFRAPNAKFGPVTAVLGPHAPPADSSTATSIGPGGLNSWSKAFLALVESTLRDGEDLAVTISYSLIRHHLNRLSDLLDAVTQSRLVVLDAGSDGNVLVSRSTDAEAKAIVRSRSWTPTGQSVKREDPEKVDWSVIGGNLERKQTVEASGATVTGLRDWSNCIFGDPLMTSVFSEEPSTEFIRGFRQQPPSPTPSSSPSSATTNIPRISSPPPDDLVEDRENAPIRLLLYECYHATACVVRQFYRPTGADSTRQEMAARRRLAAALNKLAEVDENITKRPRKGSVDIWPVKKPKSATDAAEIL